MPKLNKPIPIYSTDEDNDDYDLTELNDDYDSTPYYLYDDTNGEPPLSWKERQELEDSKYREQYGWA